MDATVEAHQLFPQRKSRPSRDRTGLSPWAQEALTRYPPHPYAGLLAAFLSRSLELESMRRPTLAFATAVASCCFSCAPSLVAQTESSDRTASPSTDPAKTSARIETDEAPAVAASALPWRSIGPANMAGRITDIEVSPTRRSTIFAATAGGGVWRTKNAGTTWTGLFQNERTSSIGDVAIAPSNPDVVWVGTGEENARNSVSWGYGVYKSTDGGETFEHAGLDRTFQIGHIAIHPDDANTVFVAALGRLWGPNRDRGVFRTKDGGQSWEKVLYLDDDTGCIDVRIDPEMPEIVHACMYERRRDGFDGNDPAVRIGDGSGLWRSEDGGDSWTRIHEGLPTCTWGRSGLAVYGADSSRLFLIVETERSGWANGHQRTTRNASQRAYMGIQGGDAEGRKGASLRIVTPDGPSDKAGIEAGDIVVRVDDVEIDSYQGLVAQIRANKPEATSKVVVLRGSERKELEITWGKRPQQRSNAVPYAGRLRGQQANIHGKQGDDGFETGGIFTSTDRGLSWTRINSLSDRPFYYSVIAVDPSSADNIYSVGVSLYASFDAGEEFRSIQGSIHVDFHAIWIDPQDSDHLLAGCDGGLNESWDRGKTWRKLNNFVISQFYNVDVDTRDPYWVYGGLQDNGTWAGPSQTRAREGVTTTDWIKIGGGDGFTARVDRNDPNDVYVTSQNGGVRRVNLAGRPSGPVRRARDVSFNWDTPYFLSPHNSGILYVGGSHAQRSLDEGRTMEAISDRLGLTERGTATAYVESASRPGLLYLGTDDGALWRTDNAGGEWLPLHDKIIGLPGPRYVSWIAPSRHETDRIYVTFDGHRSDDLDPYVFVSEDRGKTWRSLSGSLPEGSTHCIVEDPDNESLLFLGTEFGAFASLDRGRNWLPLGDLPTVPVHALVIQQRERELVAGTHGRGIWVLDIEPLRQLASAKRGDKGFDALGSTRHLFAPKRATLWRKHSKVLLGHREFRGQNPADGAHIWLWLAAEPDAEPEVTIHDVTGARVATVRGAKKAGLQRIVWNLRKTPDKSEDKPSRRTRGPLVAPGAYSARLAAANPRDGDTPRGDETQQRAFVVRIDPEHGRSPLPDIGPSMLPSPRPDARDPR